MTTNDKVSFILTDISTNYSEFIYQAEYKLKKQKSLLSRDHLSHELLSDIIYSIIKKFDDDDFLDHVYLMAQNNKLKLYIFKSIHTNTTFHKSPFLIKLFKEKSRITLSDDIDSRLYTNWTEPTLSEKEHQTLIYIDEFMQPEYAEKVFGKNWEYYVELIDVYIKSNCSYRQIEKQTNLRNVAFHYRKIWKIIREELSRRGINNIYE